ncbi:MAG: elongation factor G, partial [Deltaproteobacteria bacterium]
GAGAVLKDTVAALHAVSDRPLILREVPIRTGEEVTGFVDLVSEKAYGFKGHEDAVLRQVPEDVTAEEREARRVLLEKLADHDDRLMEEILEDVQPSAEEIEANLRKDLQADLVVEVFFGSAEGDHGVIRLLDALRGEAPDVTVTAARNGVPTGGGFLAQAFKTVHAPHVGKLSWVRVWRGDVSDTEVLGSHRVAGVYRPLGASNTKLPGTSAGDVVALGHLDSVRTGQGIAADGPLDLPWTPVIQPAAALAVQTTKRGDDVKLSSALAKLSDEDPSLQIEQNAETHDQILWGQGELHLRLALERLKARFGLEVSTGAPQVPYRETIRAKTSVHGRFKHQSGGHGAFGDVQIEIEPTSRGEGYAFEERIVGGVVPRQYFSSVDKGAREFMKQGPLGYPMVDLKVALVHGSYHAVDSSDAAFQQATRVALTDGIPKCAPVLLEPVLELEISIPNDATARVQRMVGSRRGGQLLGYDTREGWTGWDVVRARMPQTELRDLVTELRSLTQGVGTFKWGFHHLQEVDGKEAERVVEARKKYLADRRG